MSRALISSAVASMMCSKGMLTASVIASAILCKVLVRKTTKPAPPCSTFRAARARDAAVSSHLLSCWSLLMGAKSTLYIRVSAE
jgi:hypothetical protein